MIHPDREIDFLKAVQAKQQAGITAYYEFAYERIVHGLVTRFAGQLDGQLVVSDFNAAFLTVIEAYIDTGACQLRGRHIEGLTQNSFTYLIRTICFNALKKRTRQKKKSEASEASFLKDLVDAYQLTENEHKLKRKNALASLRTLRPFCQQVIRLQRAEGMSYDDLALLFDSTVGSMRGRVKRCVDSVRIEFRKLNKNNTVGNRRDQ